MWICEVEEGCAARAGLACCAGDRCRTRATSSATWPSSERAMAAGGGAVVDAEDDSDSSDDEGGGGGGSESDTKGASKRNAGITEL